MLGLQVVLRSVRAVSLEKGDTLAGIPMLDSAVYEIVDPDARRVVHGPTSRYCG